MVTVRTLAEFRSDLPDDGVEDEKGFVLFPGRGLAEAFGQMFTRLGFKVSPPEHQWEHGWDFTVMDGRGGLWCQVSDLGEICILQCELTKPYRPEILTRLNAELASDPRFHDVLWYTPHEYSDRLPGVREPVSGVPVAMPSRPPARTLGEWLRRFFS